MRFPYKCESCHIFEKHLNNFGKCENCEFHDIPCTQNCALVHQSYDRTSWHSKKHRLDPAEIIDSKSFIKHLKEKRLRLVQAADPGFLPRSSAPMGSCQILRLQVDVKPPKIVAQVNILVLNIKRKNRAKTDVNSIKGK